MMLPYFVRLLCLSLACFFLINLCVGLCVSLTTPFVLRKIVKWSPRSGARLLLMMRLLPAFFGIVAVVAFCMPSYLLLEPGGSTEAVGAKCVLLAVCCLSIWTASLGRTVRAAIASKRIFGAYPLGVCEGNGATVIESDVPILAVTGVVRPATIVSRTVVEAFTPSQLEISLRHERAHRDSRDNLKRLLLCLTPRVFPFGKSLAALEHEWCNLSEWAADDEACEGDASRALTLAEALVRMARIGRGPVYSALSTPFLADDLDLSARVDRLLSPQAAGPQSPSRTMRFVSIVCAAIVALAALSGKALPAVQEMLEHLIR